MLCSTIAFGVRQKCFQIWKEFKTVHYPRAQPKAAKTMQLQDYIYMITLEVIEYNHNITLIYCKHFISHRLVRGMSVLYVRTGFLCAGE